MRQLLVWWLIAPLIWLWFGAGFSKLPRSSSFRFLERVMGVWLSGFRARLAGLIGGVSLLWAGAAVFYVDHAASSYMGEASGRNLHAMGHALAISFATNLAERQKSIDLLTMLPLFSQGELDGPQARSALLLAKSAYKHYAWIGVADMDGTVRAATGGMLEGANVGKRPWFKGAQRGPFTGDVHEAVLLAKMLQAPGAKEPLRFVDFASPILDDAGRVRGVIGAHADWRWAREVIGNAMPPEAADKRIEVLVVNRAGEVIYPSAPAAGAASAQTQATAVPAPLLAQDGEAVVDWGEAGRYLGSSHAIKADIATALGWRIVVRQPLETALAPVSAMHRRLALLGGLGIVLLSGTAFLFAARFSRPLERLARAAQQMAHGEEGADMAFDTPSRVPELRSLETSLHEMTSRLLAKRQRLEEANASLEARVAQRTAELTDLYDHAPVGYHTVDRTGLVARINATELQLLGYKREEVEGRLRVLDLFSPACQAVAMARLAAMRRGETLPPQDARMVRKDGRVLDVRLTSVPVFDEAGTFLCSRSAVMDISDIKQLETSLARQQAINEAIVQSSPNGMALYTANGRCILANEAAAAMVGSSVADLLQQNFLELTSWRTTGLSDAAAAALSGKRSQRMVRFTSSFGKEVDCVVTLMPLVSHGEPMVLLVGKDVSDLMDANRALDKLARQDALTGLPNRLSANERLQEAWLHSGRSKRPFSVMLLDVDHFKRINDTHGHETGDRVLTGVGQRIREALRATDYVARFGGEEFLVVLSDAGETESFFVAEKIRHAVAALDHPGVGHVTVSIGLAQSSPDSPDGQDVVRLADQALYAAKGAGRNRVSRPSVQRSGSISDPVSA